ncbi:MAG: DUF167 domain-containing protein [Bacteroidia bacterium]
MILTLHVKPNSRTNELTYEVSGTIRIKITSAPEAGKANKHLVKFLSTIFETAQKNIEIISGSKSKLKNVKIDLPDEEVVKKLNMHRKETKSCI